VGHIYSIEKLIGKMEIRKAYYKINVKNVYRGLKIYRNRIKVKTCVIS